MTKTGSRATILRGSGITILSMRHMTRTGSGATILRGSGVTILSQRHRVLISTLHLPHQCPHRSFGVFVCQTSKATAVKEYDGVENASDYPRPGETGEGSSESSSKHHPRMPSIPSRKSIRNLISFEPESVSSLSTPALQRSLTEQLQLFQSKTQNSSTCLPLKLRFPRPTSTPTALSCK
ncbi:hypothetical protein N657DRAFT_232822 [Parathielavia appendiculata]|uniref:Uncharacterized protein n=1 Tax=Parathielavia appendiculata TaxID=2587402 RepID=A0AAN6Z7G3_9PEZI|nr:hypothetical protein N657DRAFT_232822 [Parathielavia appendiculata]